MLHLKLQLKSTDYVTMSTTIKHLVLPFAILFNHADIMTLVIIIFFIVILWTIKVIIPIQWNNTIGSQINSKKTLNIQIATSSSQTVYILLKIHGQISFIWPPKMTLRTVTQDLWSFNFVQFKRAAEQHAAVWRDTRMFYRAMSARNRKGEN